MPFLRDQFMGCDGKSPNVICPSDPRFQSSLAPQWFQFLPNPTFGGALNNYVVPVPVGEGLFSDSNWFSVIFLGLLIGAVWGAIFGAVAHAMTGGRRDFSSRSYLAAGQYAVTVDAGNADQAGQLLTRMTWRESGAS